MLTIEGFNQINAGSIIAKGSIQNSPLGIFMTNERQGNLLKWVAVKGYGNDWTIYCHWDEYSWEYVEQSGDKVSDPKNVQRCLPCTEEVMKLYRF
jgi:hypothetical protein